MPLSSVAYFDQDSENSEINYDFEDIADEYTWQKNYIRKPKDYSREVKLWTAVLVQAIQDFYRPNKLDNETTFRLRDYQMEAHRWFLSDRYGIGTFLWICDILDLDPTAWRNRILCLDCNRSDHVVMMDRFKRKYDKRSRRGKEV